MPGNTKMPAAYSTNPSTVKARRRKMNLSGAQKVEDAARTADYKAMIYSRKVVQAKTEYKVASDSEKSAMLEQAMRETMVKRRARGQDIMSKMAAFNAGTYQDRSSTVGPQTRVPISAFLENNGFVPSRAGGRSGDEHRGGAFEPLVTPGGGNGPISPTSFGAAPDADMTGVGSAFASANGLSSFHGRDGSATFNGYRIKASDTPAPFARTNMTPEPLPTIEGYDPTSNVTELGRRLAQLEGFVHAQQNTSILTVMGRVAQLETKVEDLGAKVGLGADGEVAKMREVMGGMREALDRAGEFL